MQSETVKEGDYMKTWKRGVAWGIVATMLVCGMPFFESHAASAIKLSASKVTLTVGKTTKIRVRNYKKKVTWKSAKKSVATVTRVGKYVGKIKAKKAGSTKIYAKCGKRKLVCKVTVKKKSTPTSNIPNGSVTVTTMKPTIQPTKKPGENVNGDQKYLADQSIAYDKEDGIYHLYFSIRLSDNQTRTECAGQVELQVYNVQQELVYNQSKSFTKDDFLEIDESDEADEKGSLDNAQTVCDVEIPIEEFTPGNSSVGTLYYSISLEDDTWFSKRALDIAYLPVRVTEQPKETVHPIITKVPEVEPTIVVTDTPEPTREPVTEAPTDTPEPTNSPTQKPTDTPEPTDTPSPKPTDTPKPTNTLEPTDTPKPTDTLEPTDTPKPTNTPGPTITPEVKDTRDEVLERSIHTLRSYIMVNGEVKDDDFCLEWDSEDGMWKCEMSYNLMTEVICYSIAGVVDGYDAVLVMESDPFSNTRSILKCSVFSEETSENGRAILSFENLDYTQFVSKDFCVMGDIPDNRMQNAANVLWYSGMKVWNDKLEYIGLSLEQVGYDNYGKVEPETIDTNYPVASEEITTSSTLRKWQRYITSINEMAEDGKYTIYKTNGQVKYFVSCALGSEYFIYGMTTEDGNISLMLTTYKNKEVSSQIVYMEGEYRLTKAVQLQSLKGTETLFAVNDMDEYEIWKIESNADSCMQDCYENWNELAQCAGMTLNQVGFDSYIGKEKTGS